MDNIEKVINWCLGIYFLYLLITSGYGYEIKVIFCALVFLYIVIKRNYVEQNKRFNLK